MRREPLAAQKRVERFALPTQELHYRPILSIKFTVYVMVL